jgi:hypothetical protein
MFLELTVLRVCFVSVAPCVTYIGYTALTVNLLPNCFADPSLGFLVLADPTVLESTLMLYGLLSSPNASCLLLAK